jgi:hypothetical protein
MLDFAESVLKDIRKLQVDSETIVLNGTITNMERYRFLMGRTGRHKACGSNYPR